MYVSISRDYLNNKITYFKVINFHTTPFLRITVSKFQQSIVKHDAFLCHFFPVLLGIWIS